MHPGQKKNSLVSVRAMLFNDFDDTVCGNGFVFMCGCVQLRQVGLAEQFADTIDDFVRREVRSNCRSFDIENRMDEPEVEPEQELYSFYNFPWSKVKTTNFEIFVFF